MTWDKFSLGELYDIGSSKRVLKSQWTDDGVPFYRGREVTRLSEDGFVENELFISEEMYSEYAKKYGAPVSGDIIITAIGTIGNSYIVKDGDRFYFKDASVLWLKKQADVSSQYVDYWLRSSLFNDQLRKGNGATVDTLSIRVLKKIAISVPQIKEQNQIVSILDEVFESIDLAKKNTERNLANAQELFENYVSDLFLDTSKEWQRGTLKEFCVAFEYGTSAKSQLVGKIPVLRMGNLQKGEIDWDKLKYTSDSDEIEKYMLADGDVLFNRTNSAEHVGKSAVYRGEQPAVFAGYLIRVMPDRAKVEPEFLNIFLNCQTTRDYGYSVMSQSVNQANINATKLKGYPISVCSLEEQKNIISNTLSIREKIEKYQTKCEKRIEASTCLKSSILKKAFAGELSNKPDKVLNELGA